MKNKFSKNPLTTGASWLIIANVLSRIIGIAYVIPWTILFGLASVNANSLFGKGYTIYQFFLTLSTVGLPSAVTQMANRLHYSEKSSFLISSTKFSIVQGLATATILWISSPLLSNGDHNLIPVLHSLAISVVMFPFLSVIRGYFQSRLEMDIVAKSEIIEQAIRVIYMLISTYIILRILKKGWVLAVVHSTLAAAIGAFFGTVYLIYRLLCILNFKELRQAYIKSKPYNMISIIKKSIPFVLIGSFLSSYQWIDQYTFFYFMKLFHPEYSVHKLNILFGVFNFNVNKLILIIVALAVSIASTILPIITTNINNIKVVGDKVRQSFLLFWAIVLPASLGLYAVAHPIYTVFYGSYVDSNITTSVTQISAVCSIFMGGSTILAMIMQSLLKTKLILNYFFTGFLIKLLLQPLLISIFKELGPMYATLISLITISYLMFKYLNSRMSVSDIIIEKHFGIITLSSFIMLILVLIIDFFLQHAIGSPKRLTQVGILSAEIIFGIIFILIPYYKFGVLKKLFK